MENEKLKELALDLTQTYPRSPRSLLGGYVVAGRALDKCRAMLAGTAGEYHFDCPLDRQFFDFTGIDAESFKQKAASGASDVEMAEWIEANSKVKERGEIVKWNNGLRYTRPVDMSEDIQLFLEDYIAENVPAGRPVYVWFDVYDLEEGRL